MRLAEGEEEVEGSRCSQPPKQRRDQPQNDRRNRRAENEGIPLAVQRRQQTVFDIQLVHGLFVLTIADRLAYSFVRIKRFFLFLFAMSEIVFGMVLAAACLHALWNAMVKGGEDLLTTMTLLCIVASFVSVVALLFFLPFPRFESWKFLAVSLCAHLGYKLCLVAGYRRGAFGQIYPIARGGAALVVLFLSFLFVGGVALSMREIVAVVAIGLSIMSLAFVGKSGRGIFAIEGRAVFYALATALFIGCYSLLDGLGARVAGNALSYVALLMALDALPIFLILLAQRGWSSDLRESIRHDGLRGVGGGVLSLAAYGIVVYAMSVSPIALVVALRETSIVIAALLGWLLLGERGGKWRIVPAACIVAAVVLLRL